MLSKDSLRVKSGLRGSGCASWEMNKGSRQEMRVAWIGEVTVEMKKVDVFWRQSPVDLPRIGCGQRKLREAVGFRSTGGL